MIIVAIAATICTVLVAGLGFIMWEQRPGSVGARTAAIIAAAALLVVIMSWIGVGVRFGAERKCSAYHDATDRPTRLVHASPYSWQCFAEVRGEWYPIDQIRSEDNG